LVVRRWQKRTGRRRCESTARVT